MVRANLGGPDDRSEPQTADGVETGGDGGALPVQNLDAALVTSIELEPTPDDEQGRQTGKPIDSNMDHNSVSSTKKVVANRLNAGKSTGPRTEDGKRRVSRNATRHGLL